MDAKHVQWEGEIEIGTGVRLITCWNDEEWSNSLN